MNLASNAYYAFYDISSNDIRNDVIRILKDIGLLRIQESVFCGTLSSQQKKDLIENVKKVMTDKEDSFLLIFSCNQCFGKVISCGKKMDLDLIVNRDESIVF